MPRRWTRISRVYLAVSVALAAGAGLILHGYVARASAAAVGLGPRAAVVVVSTPIARGSTLRSSAMRLVRMPRAFVEPGALTSLSQAAGRAALTDLVPGEVLTRTRLARVRAGPVASLVPQGLRAFAVPTSLPPGVVQAGDRVDVLATYGTGGAGQPHTETVVEGVEVLFALAPGAPGGDSGGGLNLDVSAAGAGTAVTLVLLVAPYQEQGLAFARAFGALEVAIAPAGTSSGSDVPP